MMEERIEDHERPVKVYVKRDINGEIIAVNSEIFLQDKQGWEFLDEGFGDKYAHAQSHYFEDKIYE